MGGWRLVRFVCLQKVGEGRLEAVVLEHDVLVEDEGERISLTGRLATTASASL